MIPPISEEGVGTLLQASAGSAFGLTMQLFCTAPASMEYEPAGHGVQAKLPRPAAQAPPRHCVQPVAPPLAGEK